MPASPDRGNAPPAAASEESENASPIRGTVTLASGLEGKLPPNAVLFLIARREGSGPPLAVKRIPQPHFPLDFEIGPRDRMIQTLPFVGPIQISARVDSDGNATTRTPGDLQGSLAEGVQPGASGVELVIDQVL
jgi:cytochrome c-type biogenesis protein CcmH